MFYTEMDKTMPVQLPYNNIKIQIGEKNTKKVNKKYSIGYTKVNIKQNHLL